MKSTEHRQVAYPSQQDRRAHERSLELPKRTYYAEEDQPHNNRTRPLEMRHVPNRASDKGERFVRQNDPRQESGNDLYVHDFEPQSRRRSEMVLPSIERDFPDKQDNQTSLYGKTRQVNPFGSYQPPNRGTQQYSAPSSINFHDCEELPSRKRRRIEDQHPVEPHSQGRTILVPIEEIDDRRFRYEQPHGVVYRDETAHSASDKRIVPLPSKEERARPPIRHQELQLFSPRGQMERCLDEVSDRGERYLQSRDHYQVSLSHSENVEHLQFPSRAVFAPPEYYNDSPSFFDSSQSVPRHHESSDLGFSSRHDVGLNAHSDQVYADSDGIVRRIQPLEVTERLMPSRFSDMSINYRQRDDDHRPDRVTCVPSTATAGFHIHTNPSTGALTCAFATAMANVHGHAGHAIRLLTYALGIVRDSIHADTERSTYAYTHDISDRQPAATNFDHRPSRIQQLPEMPRQPVWPVKQNASSYFQPNQQYTEFKGTEPFERRAPPPASRVAMEPWSDITFKHQYRLY